MLTACAALRPAAGLLHGGVALSGGRCRPSPDAATAADAHTCSADRLPPRYTSSRLPHVLPPFIPSHILQITSYPPHLSPSARPRPRDLSSMPLPLPGSACDIFGAPRPPQAMQLCLPDVTSPLSPPSLCPLYAAPLCLYCILTVMPPPSGSPLSLFATPCTPNPLTPSSLPLHASHAMIATPSTLSCGLEAMAPHGAWHIRETHARNGSHCCLGRSGGAGAAPRGRAATSPAAATTAPPSRVPRLTASPGRRAAARSADQIGTEQNVICAAVGDTRR